MTKLEYEEVAQRLMGERIQRVDYFEIDYEGGKEYWNADSAFDSLDYGLDLEMASGAVWG